MEKIILASGSPRRKELFSRFGIPFEVLTSNVAELGEGNIPYSQAALVNAERKADDIAAKHPDALVIGADTVIEFESSIIGKPRDPEDAFQILKKLSGKEHFVATAICMKCMNDHILVRFVERTKVRFRKLSDDEIRTYLSLVDVLDKAGAYAAQEHGDMLIESVEGSIDNVIGLPTERIGETLPLLLPDFRKAPPSL